MKYSMEFVKDKETVEKTSNTIILPQSPLKSQSNKERFDILKKHYKKLLVTQEETRKESERLVQLAYQK